MTSVVSYLYDKRTAFFLVICCLPLLFFPKINLISVGQSETAGVRFDDLILFGLCIVLFWAHITLQQKMCSIEKWVMAFVLWSLLSFVANRIFLILGWLPVGGSIFYCLRMFEYFIFFYVGILSAPLISTTAVIKWLFCWNTLIMVLQKLTIVGQFSSSGYVPLANDRLAGIASFPNETGMLLIMLFAYLLYAGQGVGLTKWIVFPDLTKLYRFVRIYWLFFVFAILITLTGARIALAALLVIFGFRVLTELISGTAFSRFLAVAFFSLGLAVMALALVKGTKVVERSTGLLSWRNVELASQAWAMIDIHKDQKDREEVRFKDYDFSWFIRIHKWAYAMKMYVHHPITYLQGVGPGFATAAVDGGFIRILTETGIVGCYILGQLLWSIGKLSKSLAWMVIGILLNMVFFDVYLAYKPMSLLFFTAGSTYACQLSHTAIGKIPCNYVPSLSKTT